MDIKQKAAAFDLFCGQLEAQIEADAQDYINDNPYSCVDDCDDDGRKVSRSYKMDMKDARTAIIEGYLVNAEDAGAYDFYELLFWHIYGEPMGSNNPYNGIVQPAPAGNPVDEAIEAFKGLPDKLAKAGQK